MTRIGVISDTHGLLRWEVSDFLEHCDLIFHAGDFSDIGVYNALRDIAPLYAVRGNNDWMLVNRIPTFRSFYVEGVNIALVHDKKTLPPLSQLSDMQIIVFGHSHQYFEQVIGGQLWLNPGSCGHKRFGGGLSMAYLLVEEGSYQVQRVDLNV